MSDEGRHGCAPPVIGHAGQPLAQTVPLTLNWVGVTGVPVPRNPTVTEPPGAINRFQLNAVRLTLPPDCAIVAFQT